MLISFVMSTILKDRQNLPAAGQNCSQTKLFCLTNSRKRRRDLLSLGGTEEVRTVRVSTTDRLAASYQDALKVRDTLLS
jgi:hypothetical protein